MEKQALEEDKKNCKRLVAHLIFIDESGFLLAPTVRKTWAPVGQTPRIRHRFRNDRISVISGLSVSPRRCHLGLYGMFAYDNIRQQYASRGADQNAVPAIPTPSGGVLSVLRS